MRVSTDTAHNFWRQSTHSRRGFYAPHHQLINLLHNIARIALHLISIRVISVAGLIFALWLCPVQVFANLGLYLAGVNLAALAVFGRYELLVVAAHDERRCADTVHLCVLTSAGALAAVLLIGATLELGHITYVTLAFAGALFARAWLRLGLTLATRHGRYDRAVKALLPHAIGQPAILVSLIYKGQDPFLAFVLSDLLGQLIAAAGVYISERHAFHAALRGPIRLQKIRELASVNFRLPTLNLTAAASALLFATTPLFFLPWLSNGILAGTLALLFRVLDMPANLTSSSISPILMKEISDRRRNDTLWFARGTFLLPVAIATVVFGLISLGGLTVNRLELAPTWHLALTVLPAVALFQASIAATAPLIDIATLAGRQKGLFALNIVSVGLAIAVLLLWRHEPVSAILMAGSIGFVRVIVMSVWLVGADQPAVAIAVRASARAVE